MIIFDTSVLLECERVDIFEQAKWFSEFGKPAVLESTINELERLDTRSSRLALDIIKKKQGKVDIIETQGNYSDAEILRIAKPGMDIVATNDRKLIKELKTNNVKVLRLRQRRCLSMC